MLTLHCAPRTISIAAAIVLVETELEHQQRRLDFSLQEQQSPAYLRVNSKGRVPALETPQGVLTETGAILEYLAALAPEKRLIPREPFQAARMREMMFYLASTMHVNHAHKMRGHRWANEDSSRADMTAKVPETMAASAAYVDTLIEGPYLLGDGFTIADAYLFTVCTWLEGDGVNIQDYPKLASHFATVADRQSAQTVIRGGLL